MNNITQWVRGNLLVVICAAVMVLSVAGLFWPIGPQIAQFRDQLREADGDLRAIRANMNRREDIPSDDSDQPMREISLTVNQAAVEELNGIYKRMKRSYEQIVADAVAFNRRGHSLLLSGLFPQSPPWITPDPIAYQASSAYRGAFVDLYERLNAGTPPPQEAIDARLQQVDDRYRAETVGDAAEETPELTRRKAQSKIKLFMEHAQTLSVYATPPGVGPEGVFVGGVFQITELANRTDKPPMAELWYSQVQLWIQEDIVEAIVMTNQDPTTGQARPAPDAPIKRLLSIGADEGYLKPRDLEAASTTGRRSGQPPRDMSLDQLLTPDFNVSETGRTSNPLYDVWLAEVRLVIESRAIPRLLNKLGESNLITPIYRDVRPLSPPLKEQFEEGYIYGDAVDLVELRLGLETLWMRHWTAGSYSPEAAERAGERYRPGLMPDVVRVNLGLPPRARDSKQSPDGSPDNAPGLPPGVPPGARR